MIFCGADWNIKSAGAHAVIDFGGALLMIRPGSLAMVSTNGHRLAHVEAVARTMSVDGEIRFLIPRRAIIEIGALLNTSWEQFVSFAVDDFNLFLGVGKRLFTCR